MPIFTLQKNECTTITQIALHLMQQSINIAQCAVFIKRIPDINNNSPKYFITIFENYQPTLPSSEVILLSFFWILMTSSSTLIFFYIRLFIICCKIAVLICKFGKIFSEVFELFTKGEGTHALQFAIRCL